MSTAAVASAAGAPVPATAVTTATTAPVDTAPVDTAVAAAAPATLRRVRTEPHPARRAAPAAPPALVPGPLVPGLLPPGPLPLEPLVPGALRHGVPAVGQRAPSAPGGPYLRLLRHEPDPDGPDAPDAVARPDVAHPAPPVPDDLHGTPDLRRRAHRVLSLVLETIDGRRPIGHVAPHLHPGALRYVRAALARPQVRPTGRLSSLHVSRPRADALEVTAVRRVGPRARAVAARFEGSPDEPDRWRCVTLRLM